MRIVNTCPGVAARHAQTPILLIRSRDLKPEAELVAAGADWKILGTERIRRLLSLDDNTADFVLRHGLDRILAEQRRSVEFPIIQKHLKEFDVIAGGGKQSAIAGHGRLELFRIRHFGELAVRALVPCHDAARFGGRHGIAGVRHFQWAEYPLFKKLVESHACDFLDNLTEDSGARAVGPPHPGIVEEREFYFQLPRLLLKTIRGVV